MKQKIVGIIPARFMSSRLPGKPLIPLLGKPMIVWVAELVSKSLGKDHTIVATDNKLISTTVNKYGFKAIMTSDKHQTGTDRLAEVAALIDAEIYLNIQGDEPTIDPLSINKVIEAKQNNPRYVINAMTKLSGSENPSDQNIPKVVFNEDMNLIYMSRLPIPGFKDISLKPKNYFKQVCIYAFNRDQLIIFGAKNTKGFAEKSEDVEILRFLEMGISVKMVEVGGNTFAVDTEDDISIVEQRLKEIHCL